MGRPQGTTKTPTYRHHRASGQAVCTLNGRDTYLGVYGSIQSKMAYDRVISEWLTAGRTFDQVSAVGDGLTVATLAHLYWVDLERAGADETTMGRERAPLRFLTDLYGDSRARDFGPLKMKALATAMAKAFVTKYDPQGKRAAKVASRTLARTTVNLYLRSIRLVFKWGAANELVPPSVWHGLQCVTALKAGQNGVREGRKVTPAPLDAVYAVMERATPPVAAMIELQLLTGMRQGEVVIMRACDIDRSGAQWIYQPEKHKNTHRGHARLVPLGPKAQAIIQKFMRPEIGAYLFSPRIGISLAVKKRYPSPKRPGRTKPRKESRPYHDHYSSQCYSAVIQHAKRRINIEREAAGLPLLPHWHPHQLRHNFATETKKRFGLEIARELCGHKSKAMTRRYAGGEIDREALAAVAMAG